MEDPSQTQTTAAEIVARPSWERRLPFTAVAILFVAFGLWFARDGFIKYPEENAQALREKVQPPHSELNLLLQRAIAVALPLAGLGLAAWMLCHSRGQYRLADGVLHVPGHPPVPLDAITRIDKRKWKKKGLAVVDYELPDGTKGWLTIDDMYYKRKPTDAIFEQIEKFATGEEEAEQDEEGDEPGESEEREGADR